jgi:BlaI family penicillinase repressor
VKSQPLANAELAVMELLWQGNPLTAREIRERLYPDANKAQHGTVQRLLQRLEDKGYVERDRSLFVHLFSAAISRQAYA